MEQDLVSQKVLAFESRAEEDKKTQAHVADLSNTIVQLRTDFISRVKGIQAEAAQKRSELEAEIKSLS